MELTAAPEEWRFSIMISGGKCAVISGAMKQLRWCVKNSAVAIQNVYKKSSTLVKAI